MYRGRVSNDEARQRSGNAENAGPEKKKDNDYYAGNVVNVYLNIDCKGQKPLICR